MKKIISIVLCICMVIAVGCMTAGCGNDEVLKKIDDLQAALQTQSGKIDELQTQNAQLEDKLGEMQTVIDGQAEAIEELKSRTTQGVFYTVGQAYEKGYITLEDVKSIAYYHNGGREYNEDIMSEDYKPKNKTSESLNPGTEFAIRRNFWDKYVKDNCEAPLSDVKISRYYGSYSKSVAVMVWWGSAYCDIAYIDIVSGICFYYPIDNEILIWVHE